MNLLDYFGFRIKDETEGKQVPSVVAPENKDGAIIIDSAAVAGGWQGYVYDPDVTVKNENEQIRRYREIAQYPEVDSAISDITDEAIVSDQDDSPVKLQLDQLKISDPLKKKFQDCFEEILTHLEFSENGHDIFRQWYVDGRLYYHVLFKNGNVKDGIAEIRQIDPLKIKKIKNIKKIRNNRGIEVVDSIEEYYVYNDKGISENSVQGIKLTNDSVVMCHSGMIDSNNNMVLGHLNKAIKPVNQLRMLEDAVVIYTMTRAPDRRIFYIDVGNLPKLKAEQYVTDIMNKFKNKLVYNASTGEIADSKKNMSMIEDFWMPRRDGGKGTEITTLQGSPSLIQADFVTYFQDKLYSSLNVPKGRFQEDSGFTIGRSQEITREELKFNKFVGRLRVKFSSLFHDLLRIQLIAKGLIRADEWDDIKGKIRYDFVRDNHFTELKDAEILNNRIQSLMQVDPYLGKYYSKEWVQKKVLRMSDEEIKEIKDQIEKEGPEAVPTELNMMQAQMQIQQEMQPEDDGSGQEQEMQMAQDRHDQKMAQNDELHQQRLAQKKDIKK
jgi:hypothetical protein